MHQLYVALQRFNPAALFVVTSLTISLNLGAQSLEGLWLVSKVMAGNQIVTPRGRWFKYDTLGNFTSGNGWLQHSSGSFTYNASDSSFLPTSDFGLTDPFGAFKLWFENNEMIWQRYENDLRVTVWLERIDELPASLADKVQGLWQFDSIKPVNGPIIGYLDSSLKQMLFLRWDREYRISNSEENTDRGYWHIHGHRPELTLISRQADERFVTYKVVQNDDEMILEKENGDSGSVVRYYHRVLDLETP